MLTGFDEFILGRPGRVHVLHPGDVAAAQEGERLETLLGSCVAVLMTDHAHSVGAMCHIVHASAAPPSRRNDTRYADAAMRVMFGRLRSLGVKPSACEAHVFGGGAMLPRVSGGVAVGDDNLRWVRDFLRREGVHVASEDCGGTRYRKVAWTVGPTSPAQAVSGFAVVPGGRA